VLFSHRVRVRVVIRRHTPALERKKKCGDRRRGDAWVRFDLSRVLPNQKTQDRHEKLSRAKKKKKMSLDLRFEELKTFEPWLRKVVTQVHEVLSDE
jgi:hypothetical protein